MKFSLDAVAPYVLLMGKILQLQCPYADRVYRGFHLLFLSLLSTIKQMN
jgi:hypothetical protein